MIILLAALAGAIIGGTTAARRKGNGLDIAQYAFVYALAFGLGGLALSILIERVFL